MKIYILLSCLSIFLIGCSSRANVTLFLKEEDSRLVDLNGKDCIESGMLIIKDEDKEGQYYRIVTLYSNCLVQTKRRMKEFEPQQWLLPDLKNKPNKHRETDLNVNP